MEGEDEIRREYKRERTPGGERGREKHCKNKNWTCNHIKKKYILELISSN